MENKPKRRYCCNCTALIAVALCITYTNVFFLYIFIFYFLIFNMSHLPVKYAHILPNLIWRIVASNSFHHTYPSGWQFQYSI